jgi:hypothetical protein
VQAARAVAAVAVAPEPGGPFGHSPYG